MTHQPNFNTSQREILELLADEKQGEMVKHPLKNKIQVGSGKWMDAQDQIQEMNRHDINPHMEQPNE